MNCLNFRRYTNLVISLTLGVVLSGCQLNSEGSKSDVKKANEKKIDGANIPIEPSVKNLKVRQVRSLLTGKWISNCIDSTAVVYIPKMKEEKDGAGKVTTKSYYEATSRQYEVSLVMSAYVNLNYSQMKYGFERVYLGSGCQNEEGFDQLIAGLQQEGSVLVGSVVNTALGTVRLGVGGASSSLPLENSVLKSSTVNDQTFSVISIENNIANLKIDSSISGDNGQLYEASLRKVTLEFFNEDQVRVKEVSNRYVNYNKENGSPEYANAEQGQSIMLQRVE